MTNEDQLIEETPQPEPDAVQYWCAKPDPEEFAGELFERIKRYYNYLDHSGRSNLYQRATRLFYGLDAEGGYANSAAVTYTGERGEIVTLRDNQYGSLVQHILTLVTGNRPTFNSRATNSDARSLETTQLADGLIDWYMTEHHLEDLGTKVTDYGIRHAEGYFYLGWDNTAGRQVVPGQYEGDIEARALPPQDVARDVSAERPNDSKWRAMRVPGNRFDLAAKYGTTPELRESILAMSETATPRSSWQSFSRDETFDEDKLEVWHFFHERTPALPQGRYAVMVGDTLVADTLVAGREMPYQSMPIIEMIPLTEDGTPMGYSRSWDLMVLQAALDSAFSTVMTNHDGFGVQTVWTPPGADFDVTDIKGMRHVESLHKPEALQLTAIAKESFELIQLAKKEMQELIGVNDVARGNPDSNIKSGAMAALVHAMAEQYNSDYQRGYGEMMKRVANHLIEVLQRYAQTERIIDVTGQRNRPMAMKFSAKSIKDIRRVAIDLGNSTARNAAGRQVLADNLLDKYGPEAVSPEQYIQVLATGRWEPISQAPLSKLRGIAAENGLLAAGKGARVLWSDMHPEHLQEHRSLLDEPSIREDDHAVSVITDHIMQHDHVWREASMANPEGLIMMDIPLHPMVSTMAAGGGAAPPPEAAAPSPGANPEPAAPPVNVMDGPSESANGVRMPSMPENPVTGELADPNQQGAIQ